MYLNIISLIRTGVVYEILNDNIYRTHPQSFFIVESVSNRFDQVRCVWKYEYFSVAVQWVGEPRFCVLGAVIDAQ